MKIKTKFTIYNLIMLIAPIAMIGVISICFFLVFVMRFPVEEMHITRAALINPATLIRAVGTFFRDNPSAIYWVLVWATLCGLVLIITLTVLTNMLAHSITKPITALAEAADKVSDGDLSFEVLGSQYGEIDDLCANFENMRQSLKRAEEKERLMKRERSMLLANISHDLKTPVTSIKGYIEGIRDGIADTPEKTEKYLDTIYAKAVAIDDMVNNLSTLSKLELSKLQFDFAAADFIGFLRDFINDYRLDLEKNNMELTLGLPNEKAYVKLDYEKMSRVIANIIDNAIKYKKGNSGSLAVSVTIEDGGVYAHFTDDGIGIENSELRKVFEGFYRVDAARSIKGSGLGLGIAKQIVEKHGGKIWLRSPGEGKGTTAEIYLPIIKYKY